MSELSYTPPSPPPPPPPPPPVQPARPAEFDFARPFSFVFQDPNWVTKILLGGLFYLAGFLLVGWFFLFGYMAALARNIINGSDTPLPEWDDLGEKFSEGLKLFAIIFLYMIPIIGVALGLGIPAAFISAVRDEEMQILGSCFASGMACLIVPVALAITFWLPAALLRAVVTRELGAAFEFRAIWEFIKANVATYCLGIAVYIVARFLGGMGIVLLCIGVIFTGFWALLVMTHGFAQVYRLRRNP
jgi:Protein of unknown function (DUF4013)